METKANEVKIYLKRLEPIDYYEEDNQVRLCYVYSMKTHMSNYVSVDRTVDSTEDPVIDFGKWLAKFYGDNIVMFYKNYKYVFNQDKLVKEIKMYG